MSENVATAVGVGWAKGKPRVCLHVSGYGEQYLHPDTARYLACQLLMTADQVDPKEPEEKDGTAEISS